MLWAELLGSGFSKSEARDGKRHAIAETVAVDSKRIPHVAIAL